MSEKSKIEKNSEENAAIMKLLDEMYRKSSSQPTPAEKKDNKKAEKKAEKEAKKAAKKAKKEAKKAEKAKNKNKKSVWGKVVAIAVSAALAIALIVTGICHIVKRNRNKSDLPEPKQPGITRTLSPEDTYGPEYTPQEETSEATKEETTAIEEETSVVEEEILDNETFEKISTNFATIAKEKELQIDSKDLVNFVSLVNLNKIFLDNPELAQNLFGNVSPEAIINSSNDAFDALLTYNMLEWYKNNSTENFIKISESSSGSQKEKMQIFEEYVDKIYYACKDNDKEQVNALAEQLINDLNNPTSKLFSLDDGTNYAATIYLYEIINGEPKNFLTKELRNTLNIYLTRGLNNSDILYLIKGCTNTKSKKLEK